MSLIIQSSPRQNSVRFNGSFTYVKTPASGTFFCPQLVFSFSPEARLIAHVRNFYPCWCNSEFFSFSCVSSPYYDLTRRFATESSCLSNFHRLNKCCMKKEFLFICFK